MKRRGLTVFFLFLATLTVYGQERKEVTLDMAISDSMAYITGKLSPETKVAVINFTAPQMVSDYVIEELIAYIVHDGKLTVVDRRDLELIQNEMDFQLSGEVSDESAQSIGKKLGAQTILSGTLTQIGVSWRMTVKALEVETAKIQAISTYTLKKDRVLTNLLPASPKTVADKIGTGALNIALGLGSYLDGDISGGITITAGYAAAAALFVIEATALDWGNPAVGVPATIGVSIAGLTFVYGFVRPFIYNRSPQLVSLLDNAKFDIFPTHEKEKYLSFNQCSVSLSYTVRF